jgi:hypothetical protein
MAEQLAALARCAQWLGEVHGVDELAVPAQMRDAMMDVHERLEMWGPGDIPNAERALSTDVISFFTALFAEMAEPDRGVQGDFRGTQTVRFVRWMREGTMQGAAVAGTPTAQVVTAECKADMLAQGARFPGDLMWLELAMWLGRNVAPKEIVGGQHAAPPQMMDGGKQAKKLGLEM